MKSSLVAIIYFLGTAVWAYQCPKTIDTDSSSQAIQHWLETYAGRVQLEGCKVEITACDLSLPRTSGKMLGEVYIVDSSNREAYLPFSFMTPDTDKIQTRFDTYPGIFHYEKFDSYFEPVEGGYESARFEFRVHSKTGRVLSLDLGLYSFKKALHQPNGNQSRWYRCGGAPKLEGEI